MADKLTPIKKQIREILDTEAGKARFTELELSHMSITARTRIHEEVTKGKK